MNYKIVLFNKQEIEITEEQKIQIDEAILDGKEGAMINGNILNFKLIAHFDEVAQEATQEIIPKKIVKNVTAVWFKKLISNKEWDSFYSYGCYCLLSKVGGEVMIGGLMPAINGDLTLPSDCYEPTDSELLQIQRFRESRNIYPRPFYKELKI